MYPFGHVHDPVTLFCSVLAVFGAVVAISSWKALRYETYDRKSLGNNRYSLVVGLVMLIGAIFLETIWMQWLREAMTVH
jgi:hypothetical protein